MKKSVAVIGLGRFGRSVAASLAKAGQDVCAIDIDQEKVEMVEHFVTYAMRADVTDAETLEGLGIENFDEIVVGIASNLEASIVITDMLKEAGAKHIICKANGQTHGRILKRVGADMVVYPELFTGEIVAKQMIFEGCTGLFPITEHFSLIETGMPKSWVGRKLVEMNLRSEHGINIVGMRVGEEINTRIDPTAPLQADATVILIGENEEMEKLMKKLQ